MRADQKHRSLAPRLRIHRIAACSLSNGPGRRFVLWVQGCPLRCEGCFNPAARSLEGGTGWTLERIERACDDATVEGITVSGGEPFLQASPLAQLLGRFRARGLNTLVYTGFPLAALKKDPFPGCRELLRQTDLLIDGPYRPDCPPQGEWAGSGNQGIIPLSRTGMEMKRRRKTTYVEQEYILSLRGELIHTGI